MNSESHAVNPEMTNDTETVNNWIKFESAVIKEEDVHQEIAGVNFMPLKDVCESETKLLQSFTLELGQYSANCKEEIPDENNISATYLTQSSIGRDDLSISNTLLNKVTKQGIKRQKGEAITGIVRPTTCMEYEKLDVCEESQLNIVSSHDHHITCDDINRMQTDQQSFFQCSNSEQKKVLTSYTSFICNVCNKSFTKSSNLTAHKSIHSGITPFTCSFCNHSFSRSSYLKAHTRTHTGETPFTCNICNKSFSHSSTLSVHKKTHSSEIPFTCNFCNKGFFQFSHLKIHKRKHTGETPFTCSICNKSFTRSFNLMTHKRIHSGETPFTCSICNKSFSRSYYLRRHKRTHTGETPYTCKICNKSFSQSSTLTLHKRTHSGETLFTCNICYKGFTRSTFLRKHMRIH